MDSAKRYLRGAILVGVLLLVFDVVLLAQPELPRMEISVNHLPENPWKIPQIVREACSEYRVICLQCRVRPETWRLESDILFFK